MSSLNNYEVAVESVQEVFELLERVERIYPKDADPEGRPKAVRLLDEKLASYGRVFGYALD